MPMETLVHSDGLASTLRGFAAERDWEQFHSPKNLVMALSGECGELSEVFQWLNEEQSRRILDDPRDAARVREEIADVLIYLVRLADVLGIDLDDAVRTKLAANARRYPVDRVKGSALKATEPNG